VKGSLGCPFYFIFVRMNNGSYLLFICALCALCALCCNNHINKTEPWPTTLTNGKTIEFSGFTWIVSNAKPPVATGPNFLSQENVLVEAAGKMQLKIPKKKKR